MPESFNPIDKSNRITPVYLAILKEFIHYTGVYGHTYVTHQTIANKVGCHQDTVLRASRVFRQLNILSVVNRGANRSCMTSLGSVLRDPKFLWSLRNVLPNLYWAYNNSSISIVKMLPNLYTLAKSVCETITARLSNDKNKDTVYTYTRERGVKKQPEFIPTSLDIKKYREYEEAQNQKKKKFIQELMELW